MVETKKKGKTAIKADTQIDSNKRVKRERCRET